MLESLQGQLIATQKLLTLLREKGDETVSSLRLFPLILHGIAFGASG